MGIKKEDVIKALGELEEVLAPEGVEVSKSDNDEGSVEKASETGLDQPEGDDMGASSNMKNKMSDAAPKGSGKEEKKKMKEAKKSFKDDLPEEVEAKVEVSDFLKSLVNTTGEAIDNLRESVVKGQDSSDEKYEELAEKVEDVQQSQAKLGVVLKAICEQIGVISNEPAREAKAETTISKGGVADRKFESPLADESAQESKLFKSLSDNPLIAKSQISQALCDLVKKGDAADTDVIGFESGGYIKPELVGKLKETLN